MVESVPDLPNSHLFVGSGIAAILCTLGVQEASHSDKVIDSSMTRREALGDNHFPKAFVDRMELVTVTYRGFDSRRHQGQIVVDKAIAKEVRLIFDEIEATGYPIKKVVPIVRYRWDDQASIDDNNTSAFNYRHVIGPGQRTDKLSNHSYGRAIDLNPFINPFVAADGTTPRPYDPSKPGTLTLQSPVTQIFLKHHWKWGGQWHGGKDYQHFEKLEGVAK